MLPALDEALSRLESISLSRGVPRVARPIAVPIANRIARESVTRTLESVRAYVAP
jgi:hypothetical protein